MLYNYLLEEVVLQQSNKRLAPDWSIVEGRHGH